MRLNPVFWPKGGGMKPGELFGWNLSPVTDLASGAAL